MTTEQREEDRWTRLIGLIWRADKARLDRIEASLDPVPPTHTVSRALPDALLEDNADNALGDALSQPITRSITNTVSHNQQPIIDLLVPVLGPLIRRSIRNAIRQIMGRMNRAADYRLNPIAHFQAHRRGMSLAEFADWKSLIYQVERVELLQADGPTLLEVCQDQRIGDSENPERYSSRGEDLILTVTGQGSFTPQFKKQIDAVLDTLQYRLANRELSQIPEFGEQNRLQIESLLAKESVDYGATPSIRIVTLLLLISTLLFHWLGNIYLDREKRNHFLNSLSAQPGLILYRVDGEELYALKDPLAPSPRSVFQEFDNSDQFQVNWKPFQSTETFFVKKRLLKTLEPPASVTIELSGQDVMVSGEATPFWAEQARVRAATVLGIASYDDSALSLRSEQ